MYRLSAAPLSLSGSEREALEKLLRRPSTGQQKIALRAKIILRTATCEGHGEIARGLGISRDMSRLWRRRWLELSGREVPIGKRLQDAPHPGGLATFSIEQITHLYVF
ncbi:MULTISPECIES: hypothetical protein [Cyanophyceae]|uniref:hypothetical protein n=1 Tax=Cyanophyceae TaxID=3028117 RepID=UPI0016835454|nr:hypothetical protein [Trichocoleus sp. FACHB-40]MBD2002758.1 hypothetical protein [Trichocoleus sp. FACHB-40]